MVADLMIAFEIATRATGGVIRLMEPDEILSRAPETTRRAANPWKLTAAIVDATGRVEIGNIPDKVFGLDNTQARKRSYFLYEADRGTMPITRTHPRQTSFQQKVLGYLAGGGADNAHGKRFGIGNFRVLTDDHERSAHRQHDRRREGRDRRRRLTAISLRRPR